MKLYVCISIRGDSLSAEQSVLLIQCRILEVLHCLLHKYWFFSIYLLFICGAETAQSIEGTEWLVPGSNSEKDNFFFILQMFKTESGSNPLLV
jgi:hypothetical protein